MSGRYYQSECFAFTTLSPSGSSLKREPENLKTVGDGDPTSRFAILLNLRADDIRPYTDSAFKLLSGDS